METVDVTSWDARTLEEDEYSPYAKLVTRIVFSYGEPIHGINRFRNFSFLAHSYFPIREGAEKPLSFQYDTFSPVSMDLHYGFQEAVALKCVRCEKVLGEMSTYLDQAHYYKEISPFRTWKIPFDRQSSSMTNLQRVAELVKKCTGFELTVASAARFFCSRYGDQIWSHVSQVHPLIATDDRIEEAKQLLRSLETLTKE